MVLQISRLILFFVLGFVDADIANFSFLCYNRVNEKREQHFININ